MSLQAAPSDRIGSWTLGERLRRDRLGEVYRATADDGTEVRLRVTVAAVDRHRLAAAVARLSRLSGPGIAPVLEAMVDDGGHAAVATPAAAVDLERRRRRGRLGAATVAATGAVLLDGLTRIHQSGIRHGSVGPAAVGIDAQGRPRWCDAGLTAVLPAGGAGDAAGAAGEAADLVACAAMLRDLGRLPPPLAEAVDPVAAGSPEAVTGAADLARIWRTAAAEAGLEVPPPGSEAALAELLPPPPRRLRLPALPRITVRPRRRRWAAGALAVLAAGFVAAAVVRGSGSPFRPPHDYLPARAGMTLAYRLTGESQPVTLRVTQAGVVAGVYTVALQKVGGPSLGSPPLGLGGTTLRDQGDQLVRTAVGGAVRDLVAPMAPGTAWTDQRGGVAAGIVTTEVRTLLGATSLVEPGGRFDGCAVVSLASTSTNAGGAGQSANGTVWMCPGVGLTRAVLRTPGQPEFDVDLVSVG